MAKPKTPKKCLECKWCHAVADEKYECHLMPPVAAPAYDAPHLWEYPLVKPDNTFVCSRAESVE